MKLSNNPTCTKCVTEETSVYILCDCVALASLRQAYLDFFIFDPENIMNLSTGTIWHFGKEPGLL
jgi:hypothetical protein